MTRYEIVVETYSGGGLYELEERTTYKVVLRETREVVMEFQGESSSHYDGSGAWASDGTSGVTNVKLADDGEHVLVTDHAGTRKVRITGA